MLLRNIFALFKDTIIYGIGNALVSMVSFALLPLYTKFLTPEDYGYLSLFMVYQAIIDIVASFGLSSGFFRYYIMANDEAKKHEVLSTCVSAEFAFMGILFLLVIPFRSIIAQSFFHDASLAGLVVIVTLTALASSSGTIFFSLIRAKRKPELFAGIQLAKILVMTMLNIFFVVFAKLNYRGVIYANAITMVLSAVVMLIAFRREYSLYISPTFFKRLMKFVYPVFLVNVCGFVLNLSDRLFLNHYLTTKDVGLYSFGTKIGSIVSIGIIAPFSTAVVPYAFSIAKSDNFKYIFSKIIKYFILTTALCSLALLFFSRELIAVMSTKSFWESWPLVGPTLLSGLFYGVYYAISIQIDIVEKTYLATFATLAGVIISVLTNIVLIPVFKIYGSACASCLANAAMLGIMYYFCQKHNPVRYEIHAIVNFSIILVGNVVLFIIIQRMIHPDIVSITIKCALLLLLPMEIYFCGVLDSKEKNSVKALFKKRLFDSIIKVFRLKGDHVSN